MALIDSYTINGSFGEVRDENGDVIAEVQEIGARVRIERREVRRAGTRKTGYKAMATVGEGTIRSVKVTSRFAKLVTELMRSDRQVQYVGSLLVKLDDPEALGAERVLLKNVKFWEVPIGFQVGEIVEEDIPFTFDDVEFLDVISGDPTKPANRYAALD